MRNPKVYHATGNTVPYDRLSTEYVGSSGGEGKRAFGWGIYLTNTKKVADEYQINLSRIVGAKKEEREVSRMLFSHLNTDRRLFDQYLDGGESFTGKVAEKISKGVIRLEKGRIYTVDIPDSDSLLQWDKPLTKQPKKIKDILRKSGLWGRLRAHQSDFSAPSDSRRGDGQGVYAYLTWILGSDHAASDYLKKLGIPGHEYPAGSLSGFKTTSAHRNFLIWDDSALKITEITPRMKNPSLSFNSGRLKINAAIKRTNVKGIIVFRQKVAQSGYRVVHAVGNEFEVLSPYLLNLRDLEEWLAGKGLRMVGNWVW